MDVYCGIDWAEDHPDIALAGRDGKLLARRRISDDAAGLAALPGLLDEHGDTAGDLIPVAIETPRGLLTGCPRATGRKVYPINPMAAARYRDRHSVSGSKSGRSDPVVLANVLRTDIGFRRPLSADSELAQAIAVPARAQHDAVWDPTTAHKRSRTVPLIEEVRPLVERRLDAVGHDPSARIFTGPRGGRITTAVLRDATHWDEVVTQLGYEHLRRHDLRHTGLTWMADAGVPVHVLRKIAGHGSLVTTQRYLHPDAQAIADAATALSAHLTAKWSPDGPQLRLVKDSE